MLLQRIFDNPSPILNPFSNIQLQKYKFLLVYTSTKYPKIILMKFETVLPPLIFTTVTPWLLVVFHSFLNEFMRIEKKFFLSKVTFIEWYCCDRGSEEVRKKEGKIFGNCRYYISHRFPLEYLQNTQ